MEFTYIQVDRERQQLIHNTGAPGLVLTLLKQGSSMLVNRQNADCEISEFVSELFHIFAHCYRFMRTYTWENHEYLEELGAQVGLLTHLVSQQVFGAELLAQVLAANQSLLKHASESYMRRLVDHVSMQGKVRACMRQACARVDGVCRWCLHGPPCNARQCSDLPLTPPPPFLPPRTVTFDAVVPTCHLPRSCRWRGCCCRCKHSCGPGRCTWTHTRKSSWTCSSSGGTAC